MKTKNGSPSAKPSAAKKLNANADSSATVAIFLTKTVNDKASKVVKIRGITLSQLVEELILKDRAKSLLNAV
jgi:hypothetical protein